MIDDEFDPVYEWFQYTYDSEIDDIWRVKTIEI